MSQLVQLAPVLPAAQPMAGPLVDTFGRVHSDLRISVTDHCNIRCFYCMPEEGGEYAPLRSLLTFPQIAQVAETAIRLGIRKLRITGGEPLLRPDLAALIARLAELPGVEDLALTTNAVLLGKMAQPLYRAGLRRLNVHLDTLDPDRFRQITRRDDLPRVLAGIAAARDLGFQIKLNAVAVKGLTEPDVAPLVAYGREHGFEVRFVEFMPLDSEHLWSLDRVLTADEMIATVTEAFGPLAPVPDADPRAPATQYQMQDGYRLGFIPTISRPFCLNCNRLRLTADGKLRYCLFAREETPIAHLLGDHASPTALEQAIRATVWQKWSGHDIHRPSFEVPQRAMYSIGG